MIKVITKTGFETEIKENVMNDMEIVDAIAMGGSEDELDRMKGVAILCKKIFGNDLKKLYDHVRSDDGRVPPDLLEEEILDVLDALEEAGKK